MTETVLSVVARPGIGGRLARLIRVRSVGDGLEDGWFERIAALLTELYPLTHERLERERPVPQGMLFRWRGARDADPLVLMAHLDVVPADPAEGWTDPPFAGTERDGWVHGRGALDDKGPLLVILEAVENLLAAGFEPERDVYLAFGGDEESYGVAAAAIAAALRDRGVEPWLVLDEGGAVVDAPFPFVDGQVAMIGVAEKGVLTLRLAARGGSGHASVPPAMTAVRRVSRAVHRLGPTAFPPRAPATLTAMLVRLADSASGPGRLLYRTLAACPPLAAGVFAAQGGEAAAFVRTTVAATMLAGGTAANVLPAEASATVNLRIVPGETVAATVRKVRRRIADRRVGVTVIEGDDPSPQSPVDDDRFAALTAALTQAYPAAPAVPYLMMQASDARHFHRLWPAVYRFAPLRMSAAQRASIHGVDERVEVAALESGERFHRALIRGLR